MKETWELNVEIKEVYKIQKPPYDAKKTVKRLLSGIPKKYTNGLGTVVIRNSESLNRKRKKQKYKGLNKTYRSGECCGFYHPAFQCAPAWIELIIDQIIPFDCGIIKKTPFFRELMVSEALFHEIGHHIHQTIAPEHKEKERVADEWKDKLISYYFRNKYGNVLTPLWIILRPFKRAIRSYLRKYE